MDLDLSVAHSRLSAVLYRRGDRHAGTGWCGCHCGEVLKVTPTMRNHLMSDGVSRAHVRVRWSNGYVAIVPEGGLVRA